MQKLIFMDTKRPMRPVGLVLLYVLIGLGFPGRAGAQPLLEKTVVWQEKEDGYFTHFVYGLTVTRKGAVLAFAEARIANGSDDGAHHIVMKRSTDKGKSFSESRILVESRNGQCWANPTALLDRKTGRIFLFYALNEHNARSRVFYRVSRNEGRTWSAPVELTGLFASSQHGWTFHLPGPGHGIQLKDGRLVVPVWHRKSIAFPARQRNYGVTMIYSDNGGKSWQTGAATPVGELNESQVVEQQNGDLLLIGRTLSGLQGSYQAKLYSRDRGSTWSDTLAFDTGLTGRACDIGLVRHGFRPNVLLVSQPASARAREQLTLRMSLDEGRTWPLSKVLEPGLATYSDLALLPDGTVICLFGTGGGPTKAVSLLRFNLDWLTGGAPVGLPGR